MTYSTQLERGWAKPQVIYQLPTLEGGFTYSFNVYPDYDPTHKTIPISWSEFTTPSAYYIGMANVNFA